MKNIKILCAILILIIVGYIVLMSVTFRSELDVEKNGISKIYINKNTTFREFVNQMKRDSIVGRNNTLYVTGYMMGLRKDNFMTPGCYPVYPSMTNSQLLQRVRRGEQIPVKLMINNIRLPSQFASKIGKQMMVDSAEIMDFVTSEEKMKELGFEPKHLFALVLRNTYEVWWTASVESIMKRLKKENDKFWDSNNRREKAEKLGLTIPEVVTLASIVEEETNYQPEKSRVAGLYLNRLKRGIRLQSDPTVRYALGDFTINQILFEHLKVDNPYNTYKYRGLPPGPIKLPSIASIDAVLNAEKHRYIYMCANDSFDGTHKFAKTLSEHNRNAAKYHVALRKWLREKKNKSN